MSAPRRLALLILVLLAPPLAAQDADGFVFTTVGAGVTSGVPDDPYGGALLSASLSHTRVRGWRTLRVGASHQAEVVFGSDNYTEVHLGAGGTATAGPMIFSATAGPSIGYGTRGVYGPAGPPHEDGTLPVRRVRQREGPGVGLRAMAQAVLVVAPELGVGVEATHDQNTLLPTSGIRLLLSLGTHRRSLIR